MAFDVSTIAPKARERYLRIGRQYGSTDTLNQANKTLKGLELHGKAIAVHGFGSAKQGRLVEARDALIAAGVGRNEQVGQKKVTSKTFVAAMKEGKTTRESARSILGNALFTLEELGDEETARKVDVVLEQTRTSQEDPEKLAAQLDTLHGGLTLVAVEQVVKEDGGPEAAKKLTETAGALRAAAKERAGSATTAATEHLDVLDGIVVTLARGARKAARAAARTLKQPAMASAFELSHLYTSGGSTSSEDAAPAKPATPAAPTKPAAGDGSCKSGEGSKGDENRKISDSDDSNDSDDGDGDDGDDSDDSDDSDGDSAPAKRS